MFVLLPRLAALSKLINEVYIVSSILLTVYLISNTAVFPDLCVRKEQAKIPKNLLVHEHGNKQKEKKTCQILELLAELYQGKHIFLVHVL